MKIHFIFRNAEGKIIIKESPYHNPSMCCHGACEVDQSANRGRLLTKEEIEKIPNSPWVSDDPRSTDYACQTWDEVWQKAGKPVGCLPEDMIKNNR